MDDWDFCFELQLSERDVLLVNSIWGDVTSAEFAKAVARSHAAIDDGTIESDGTTHRFYGTTSIGLDQDSLVWVRTAITQFMPSILRAGLVDSLQELAQCESGVIFVEQKSFLPSDLDLVIEHGTKSLLDRLRSHSNEGVDEATWMVSIRSASVANVETLTSLGISPPSEYRVRGDFLRRVASFAKNKIVTSEMLQKECHKILSTISKESKTFIRREFISWAWVQTWVGRRIPPQVFQHHEALILLLKTHFKKQTVNSEELAEIGDAVEVCCAYITEIVSIWYSSTPINLEMFRNLCDIVLANAPDLTQEEWTDCVSFFERWQFENQDESLYVVIEKVRKKVRATIQRRRAQTKARNKRRSAGTIASHRVRCESCGELIEKGEHCECNWNQWRRLGLDSACGHCWDASQPTGFRRTHCCRADCAPALFSIEELISVPVVGASPIERVFTEPDVPMK